VALGIGPGLDRIPRVEGVAFNLITPQPQPDNEASINEAPTVQSGRRRSYSVEGIVLRTSAIGEADRLVTLMTPGKGKILLSVRGARRITSRLGGHIDVLNRVRVTAVGGRRFDVVTGAEALETFGELKQHLDRIALGFYLAELIDALVPEAVPYPKSYTLLLESLRFLNLLGPSDSVLRYVEFQILEEAGYLPELNLCLECGEGLQPGAHKYSPSMGGVLCDSCMGNGSSIPLSLDALKVLRYYARQGFDGAARLRLTPARLATEIESLLAISIQFVLDRKIMSAEFVDHLRILRERANAVL
jgi:DNA repair protein RecO (recombination protein O)